MASAVGLEAALNEEAVRECEAPHRPVYAMRRTGTPARVAFAVSYFGLRRLV